MFAKSHSLIRYGITHLQEVLVVLIMRAKKPGNENWLHKGNSVTSSYLQLPDM